ncbi:hypothetical protein B7463_g9549, partial [Scytalidium lignicola]
MPILPCSRRLDELNTLGLRSFAPAYININSLDLLGDLSIIASNYSCVWVIGSGSNIILPEYLQGLVIHPTMRGIVVESDINGEVIVKAAAGEEWHQFVVWTVQHGLGGLENLALIPGTVGASPVQNIGAYGAEASDCLYEVTAWDLTRKCLTRFSAADCMLGYRTSRFKNNSQRQFIIVAVAYKLKREGWRPNLSYPDLKNNVQLKQGRVESLTPKDVFQTVCRIRCQKFSGVSNSAGSFFKNPVISDGQFRQLQARHIGIVSYSPPNKQRKLAAGWLIEQCGLKGYSLGRVGVHKTHALILTNNGGASCEDILQLASMVRSHVYRRYEILLEIEPVYFNEHIPP